jgi:cephalosporin-C deacetylase-like acetyl esterase/predicted Ser/Thr protein kinase
MPLSAGDKLGPYEILAPIGAGGMGEVYRARDTRLNRSVAIKISKDEFTDRFEREAHLLASVNHPHICQLYDVGPNYLVFEYIDGAPLKGPMPSSDAVRVAIQIAEALEEAHRHGIIHRDLKPANILLTTHGAKVLDFGLAKRSRESRGGHETQTLELTSAGLVMGTPGYMAPEQWEGKPADARSDIYAFGCVLYEMVTGKRATEKLGPVKPEALQDIIQKCLAKDPAKRWQTAGEVRRQLEDCRALDSQPVSGINFKVLLRQSKRPSVAIPALLILLALGSLLAWWFQRISGARWARDQALPRIAQLIDQEKVGDAYALAVQAERYIPRDPMLVKAWDSISWLPSITTTPPGVSVFRRNYNAPDSAWEMIGRSPIEKKRVPLVNSQWKFELQGYATVERATLPDDTLKVTMDEEAKAPAGMVPVRIPLSASGQIRSFVLYGLPGFEDLPAVPLTDYWIDKYEVTNAQFKQFLDQGGYRKQEYWKQEFRKDGGAISWAVAVALFVDKTGRPGPATWVQGEYPRGEEDFPVTGVSWFEAAAYAEFVGKSLPTIYHWDIAASPGDSASMAPASNFAGQGSARVGKYGGMSWCGAYDMAGNVKEWCWNEANSAKRYILGGAWNEPPYLFTDADARSPFDRSANFGFRCAKYVSAGVAKARDPVARQARDFSQEKPVSDQLFQIYKGLYSYDKTPLHAVVESARQTGDWKQEKITFDAAYGNERVIAYLFLPVKARPPFQTVVYFPGANAVRTRSSGAGPQLDEYDFLVKSGRAVMVPLYKSTYERGDGVRSVYPATTSSYRDHVIAWSKDLRRSIDYLDTRSDIDHNKLAYEGSSWGAAMASLMTAVEDRIRACVLVCPGFYLQRCLPEVDLLNFAPRVKVPVLMLNGRFDFIFPLASSQEPMFRLLGTPKEQKRRVVYDTGHDVPRNELIKESLDWLDRYLGPVK